MNWPTAFVVCFVALMLSITIIEVTKAREGRRDDNES